MKELLRKESEWLESKNEEHSSNNTGSKETRRKNHHADSLWLFYGKTDRWIRHQHDLGGRFLRNGHVRIWRHLIRNNGGYDTSYKSSYKRSKKCIDSCGYAVYVLSGICLWCSLQCRPSDERGTGAGSQVRRRQRSVSTDRSNHQSVHTGCGPFGTDPAVLKCIRRIQGAGKIRRGS